MRRRDRRRVGGECCRKGGRSEGGGEDVDDKVERERGGLNLTGD